MRTEFERLQAAHNLVDSIDWSSMWANPLSVDQRMMHIIAMELDAIRRQLRDASKPH